MKTSETNETKYKGTEVKYNNHHLLLFMYMFTTHGSIVVVAGGSGSTGLKCLQLLSKYKNDMFL